MATPLGIYVSVPFCKAKCTFCNFASDAFSPTQMQHYTDRLVAEIHASRSFARTHGLIMEREVDSLFFGGGTPSLLSPAQMASIFHALRSEFDIAPDAEITVEAAPGQISDAMLQTLLAAGVNRISLGVQSFVNIESRAVGRLHTANACLEEITRLRSAGFANLNLDLIAGLPHQTPESFGHSLQTAIASGVQHVSVYMLEVDEDSRLGREVGALRAVSQLAVVQQEARYSAAAVPDDDTCAALYEQACAALQAAGLEQYEISNFARNGYHSRHNLRYWLRTPYIGFGLDAHSMLLEDTTSRSATRVSRFANSDAMPAYLSHAPVEIESVDALAAFEESVFLGLRLTAGIDLKTIQRQHGRELAASLQERAHWLQREGLMQVDGDSLRLTARGRVLSSTVFGELLATPAMQ